MKESSRDVLKTAYAALLLKVRKLRSGESGEVILECEGMGKVPPYPASFPAERNGSAGDSEG